MGDTCSTSKKEQVLKPQNPLQIQVQSEFAPFLSLKHPQNINQKFTDYCHYLPEYIGDGFRKTHAYVFKLPKEQLQKKRDEYWDTRVQGDLQCWQAIKMSLQSDDNEALAILAAVGLKLVNKSIQIAYDESGFKYDIPIFVINDPKSYQEPEKKEVLQKKNLGDNDTITQQIKIRCTKMEDVQLTVQNDNTIKNIKDQFVSIAQQKSLIITKVRFFLCGKELQDDHQIYEYDINNNLIQAFIIGDNKQ